jgi:hypothetical protein
MPNDIDCTASQPLPITAAKAAKDVTNDSRLEKLMFKLANNWH